jgi:hypothetical protein
MKNEKKIRTPDAFFEIMKSLPNTLYPVGEKLEAYYTNAHRLSIQILDGIKPPRVWKHLDQDEIEKLLELKYIKKVC